MTKSLTGNSIMVIALFLTGCANQPIIKSSPNEPQPASTTNEPQIATPESAKLETVEPAKPETTKSVTPEITEVAKPETVESVKTKPEKIAPKTIVPTDPVMPTPMPAQLYSLNGQILLDQSALKRKDAEVIDTVIYFEPTIKNKIKLAPTNQEITTLNKRFNPDVLVVTVGSEVSFPNMDRILHNVFSVSPVSQFDLGLYSAGTTKSTTFDQAGIVYVHCNVHHSMQADILVLDTPHYTKVDENGQFTLRNIDQLNGTLNIWHPRGNIKSIKINSDNSEIKQTIAITRPKVPKHTNKFGQSYRPTKD